MKQKGFTLIELIAVITLFAIIITLAIPAISNQLSKKRQELATSLNSMIETATSIYLDNNKSTYKKTEGNVYCIKLQNLTDDNLLSETIYDNKKINKLFAPESFVKSKVIKGQYIYEVVAECEEIER